MDYSLLRTALFDFLAFVSRIVNSSHYLLTVLTVPDTYPATLTYPFVPFRRCLVRTFSLDKALYYTNCACKSYLRALLHTIRTR